jgi:hypothetical protein
VTKVTTTTFTCPACGAEFETQEALDSHGPDVHGSDKETQDVHERDKETQPEK